MSKWLKILEQIGPIIIATTVPGGALIAPAVVQAIAHAEQIKGATGAEKKAHVEAIASLAAQSLNAAAGESKIDPALVSATAGQVIDAVVGAVNIVHQAQGPETPAQTTHS